MTDAGKEFPFTALEEAASYLSKCRPRKLPNGDWGFEAHQVQDRTSALRTFFYDNPQHCVSLNAGARFIQLSEKALARLNEQLPETSQVNPEKAITMTQKFR